MANTKTTIELNGTLYDATTGTAMAGSTPKPATTATNMDGFFKPTTPTAVARTTPNPAPARQPERSKTLMRHVIDKPTVVAPQTTSVATTPVEEQSTKDGSIVTPTIATERRKERAQQFSQSPSISKFGSELQPKVEQKVAHMPVQAAPESTPPVITRPPIKTPDTLSLGTAKIAPKEEATSAVSFTDAIANATSHEQPKTAKKRSGVGKIVGISAAGLSVLLLVGFVAFKSVPTVQMQLAATKAGFSASLPGYTPSGFGMDGGIDANAGAVTVKYHSNSDDRSFEVTQKPSNWTSDSLLTNHVAADKKAYQTYEDKGKTIYIYDGSSATWVNGGVWYEIKGNSSLTSDQLLHIANSF